MIISVQNNNIIFFYYCVTQKKYNQYCKQMQNSKATEFSKLFKFFKSCVFSSNQQHSPDRVENISEIQTFTSCTMQEAQIIISCCPNLKRLMFVSISEQNVNDQLELLNSHPSLEYIGVKISCAKNIKASTEKIKEIELDSSKRLYVNQIMERFPRLVKLKLSSFRAFSRLNTISTKDLESLARLKDLRELSLYEEHLDKQVFDGLSLYLPQVEKLYLSKCSYEGHDDSVPLPSNLKQIYLQISSNNVFSCVSFLVEAISKKQILVSLHVQLSQISIRQEEHLIKLLTRNPLVIKKASFVNNCSTAVFHSIFKGKSSVLEQVQISLSKSIDFAIVRDLAFDHKNIKTLTLSYCHLDNSLVPILSEFKKIENLSLYLCHLNNKGAIYLKKMKTLRVLDMRGNSIEKQVCVGIRCNLIKAWRVSIFVKKSDKKENENMKQLNQVI